MTERPPSIDRLARQIAPRGLPHPIAVEVARAAVADGAVDDLDARAQARMRVLLRNVVNATGVLLHTNLGRAPLGAEIGSDTAGAATNLELDLATGARGSRQDTVGPLLATATGAEAAMVVNNGAAAVLLVLAAVAGDGRVAVSRGELVEIGGGFRVPEVMAQSGVGLVEVGTTNRTHLRDYRWAVDHGDGVAAVMKVHTSNYRVVGFTAEVGVAELATLGTTVIVDLGSGLLDAACPWLADGPPSWLDGEPAARQTLAAGADVVTFSGDKLLGGPQAGIIAGRADLVERCARHPLARALRPGGLVLGALQATVLALLRRDGEAVAFWRMASTPLDVLSDRAHAIAERAPAWSVTVTRAVPGAGSLPGVDMDSVGLTCAGDHREALRAAEPAVVARVDDDRTVCDLRSVPPHHDDHLAAVLSTTP